MRMHSLIRLQRLDQRYLTCTGQSNIAPCTAQKCFVGRGNVLAFSPIAWNVAFREADDVCRLSTSSPDGVFASDTDSSSLLGKRIFASATRIAVMLNS